MNDDKAEPAPTGDPGNELTRLLPGLASKARTVIDETEAGEGAPLADYVIDVARAVELLLGERERLTDMAERSFTIGAGEISKREAAELEAHKLRARVDELEVEVAKERAAFTGANTAWSRVVVLQEQAQDERDAMRARAEEAERKLAAVAELQRSTAADLDAARAQLRFVSAGPADVWRWQGDGHDDPASLACPVVMSASTLREFVAARERVGELEALVSTENEARHRSQTEARGLRASIAILGATPPPGTVAALLLKVEEAANDSVRRLSRRSLENAMFADGLREAARLIIATLGAPSALDRAAAEVCAVRLTGAPDPTADDIMGNIVDLAAAATRDGSTRNRFLVIGRLALAGAMKCDAEACAPADGGKEPG